MKIFATPPSGSGSFTAGPLLSGIAGNQNDTVARTPTKGDIIYATAAPLWDRLLIGTQSQALTVSAGGVPAWASLGVVNGATGITSYTSGDLIYASGAATLSKLAIGTNGNFLQVVAGAPAWHLLLATDAAMATNRILGRTTAGTGAVEELTIGTGLSLSAGSLKKAPTVTNLTDAATITVDAAVLGDGGVGRVTLGGNRTLGAPSNPVDGQVIVIEVTQDGTGNRTLSYNAVYLFSTDVPSPTLSTAAGKMDTMAFRYNSTLVKWICLAVNKGFS